MNSNLENSRRSAIDDLEKSIIEQIPITHLEYRELDENASISEMKKIVMSYVE